MRFVITLLAIVTLVAVVPETRADILINGDFENGQFAQPGDGNYLDFGPGYFGTVIMPNESLLEGWDISLSPFDPDQQLSYGPPYGLEWTEGEAEQERWIDLNRGGDLFQVSQTIVTEAGRQYRLAFDLLAGAEMGGAVIEFEITGSATQLFQFSGLNSGAPHWQSFEHLFEADSDSSYFAVRAKTVGNDPLSGPQIDHLSLTAVPEPGCFNVIFAASILLGFIRRHRALD